MTAAASEAGDDLAALVIRGATSNRSFNGRIEEIEFDADDVAGKAPERFLVACGASAAVIEAVADSAKTAVAESGRAVIQVRLDSRGLRIREAHPDRDTAAIAPHLDAQLIAHARHQG